MRRMTTLVLAATFAAFSAAPLAQQQFDRKKVPDPGPTPVLRVPTWTTDRLANGAELIVSERKGLPLVSLSITLVGGTRQFEAATKVGVAGFAASMLREGTKTRDGEALAVALQLLGTNVGAGVGAESGSISFQSTTDKFAPTLDILADMLVNSTFPAAALERLRAQRLVQLAQAGAQPEMIASRVYSRVLYGAEHPFGRTATEATVTAVTREDVVAFHNEYFKPGRAIVTVVGDVNAATVKRTMDKALAEWTAGGEKPSFEYPAPLAPKPTTIYLVDKAGATQSIFNIGLPGPPRNTPDYAALEVMNFILGGHFQSRLNANIREEKGYSYGVGSSFSFGKGPGPFTTGGGIVSDKTDAALVEFMKELRGIHGGRAITDDEMKTARDSLIQGLPDRFSTLGGIGSSILSLYLNDLPMDYYQNYPKAISAVTKEDVLRVARKYVNVDHLNIVIVGDRKTIEGPLKATGIAPIVILDSEGMPQK
jgi:predicted Zn-dependent peptidase